MNVLDKMRMIFHYKILMIKKKIKKQDIDEYYFDVIEIYLSFG